MNLSRTIALALGSTLLAACSSDHAVLTSPLPDSVALTLSSADAMTSTGDTRTVTAVIHGTNGATTQSPTWTSSAPNVATVTASGASATITAVNDGTASITMSSGVLRDSVKVTVHRRLARVSVTAPSPVLKYGQSMQMVATALDARGHELTTITSFHWASSSSSIALFNTTGLVTAIFTLNVSHSSTISAEASLDGVSMIGVTQATAVAPLGFDHAALLAIGFEDPVLDEGVGIAYFTSRGNQIDYVMTWNNLSGPALAAHLHWRPDATNVGPILVDLAPTPSTTKFGALFGTITAADIRSLPGQPPITIAALAVMMGNFSVYLDVHTANFANGEISGPVESTGPFSRH